MLKGKPLGRYCPECGKPLSIVGERDGESFHSGESYQRKIDHYASTLCSESDAVFIVGKDYQSHLLNERLEEPSDAILVPPPTDTSGPVMNEGYVFLPTRKGVFAVDLIKWVQREGNRLLPLHDGVACSRLAVAGTIVCAIVRNGGTSVIGWKDLQPVFEIALSESKPSWHYGMPWLAGGRAYVIAHNGKSALVYISDLVTGGEMRSFELGERCVFVEPLSNGIACLVEAGGRRRLLKVSQQAVEEVTRSMPDRTSWFRYNETEGRLAWGDGHYLWMSNHSDSVQVDELGSVRTGHFSGNAFFALSNRDHGSFLLAIDQRIPSVVELQPIPEQPSASAFVLACGRAVVSDERRLASVRLP